jgi:hypothetical protein
VSDMLSTLLKPRQLRRTRVTLDGPLLVEVRQLEPGHVLRLVSADGTREVVIVPADDFDHLLSLVGMRT